MILVKNISIYSILFVVYGICSKQMIMWLWLKHVFVLGDLCGQFQLFNHKFRSIAMFVSTCGHAKKNKTPFPWTRITVCWGSIRTCIIMFVALHIELNLPMWDSFLSHPGAGVSSKIEVHWPDGSWGCRWRAIATRNNRWFSPHYQLPFQGWECVELSGSREWHQLQIVSGGNSTFGFLAKPENKRQEWEWRLRRTLVKFEDVQNKKSVWAIPFCSLSSISYFQAHMRTNITWHKMMVVAEICFFTWKYREDDPIIWHIGDQFHADLRAALGERQQLRNGSVGRPS